MSETLHVLVVDDDEDLRNSTCLALTILGCHVTSACQAIEAAQLFGAQEDVRLVLSDLNMGGSGLDGNDLFHQIHNGMDQRGARFVLVTGSNERVIYELEEQGALIIPKPIGLDQLEQLVRAQA